MKESDVVDHLRQSKVGNLDERRDVVCQQNILVLEVAMCDVQFMYVLWHSQREVKEFKLRTETNVQGFADLESEELCIGLR